MNAQAKEAEIYPTYNQISPSNMIISVMNKRYLILYTINLATVCIVAWKGRKLVQCRYEVVAGGGRTRRESKMVLRLVWKIGSFM